MKSDFIAYIGNARRQKNEKFRVQISVFLICLILSVFIWALVRLSKDYYYAVEYDLNYTNLPGNLRLIHISDSTLTLKIKLQGFDFFSEQFLVSQERSFDVSLKNIRIRNLGEHTIGYLLTSRLGRDIIAQTNFSSDVYIVSPDTLFFEFEKQSIKRMPVKPASGLLKMNPARRDTLLRITDSLLKKPLRR